MAHGLLVPQPTQYFTETVVPLDLETLDVALPPGEFGWIRFAERLGVAPIPAPGSHEACFTRPAELAESFLKA